MIIRRKLGGIWKLHEELNFCPKLCTPVQGPSIYKVNEEHLTMNEQIVLCQNISLSNPILKKTIHNYWYGKINV